MTASDIIALPQGEGGEVSAAMTDRAAELGKPKFGQSCNGCGYCCETEICALGAKFLERPASPCPALERSADRTWCGLVLHPSKYLAHHGLTKDWADTILGATISSELGIGRGCCANEPTKEPT